MTYDPTPKQEQAIREWIQEAIIPLIEQVLVKKLGQAMSFAEQEVIASPRKPLKDEEIEKLMPNADGTAEANKVWVKDGDFPYCEYDEVDAWSKPLVIQIARAIEAAHGIKGEA